MGRKLGRLVYEHKNCILAGHRTVARKVAVVVHRVVAAAHTVAVVVAAVRNPDCSFAVGMAAGLSDSGLDMATAVPGIAWKAVAEVVGCSQTVIDMGRAHRTLRLGLEMVAEQQGKEGL